MKIQPLFPFMTMLGDIYRLCHAQPFRASGGAERVMLMRKTVGVMPAVPDF